MYWSIRASSLSHRAPTKSNLSQNGQGLACLQRYRRVPHAGPHSCQNHLAFGLPVMSMTDGIPGPAHQTPIGPQQHLSIVRRAHWITRKRGSRPYLEWPARNSPTTGKCDIADPFAPSWTTTLTASRWSPLHLTGFRQSFLMTSMWVCTAWDAIVARVVVYCSLPKYTLVLVAGATRISQLVSLVITDRYQMVLSSDIEESAPIRGTARPQQHNSTTATTTTTRMSLTDATPVMPVTKRKAEDEIQGEVKRTKTPELAHPPPLYICSHPLFATL
jgi:hypothetical protein